MLTSTSINAFRSALNGKVIVPTDDTYDAACTVYYGGFDRRPSIIVQAADAADVARTIALGRSEGGALAVRSGGHSLAGHGTVEDGIVLDLRRMRALDLNVGRRTAWAESGLTTGAYTTAAGAHGLATGFGDSGGVGIGGITLGGGVGYLVRKHGLTIDDLLAAEVVTADGERLHVDADNHADLFWALRGGGGNFGVVTRFQFRLHELPTVVGGMMILPATPEIVASFVAEAAAAPDELSVIAMVMMAPPMPFVPQEHHGRPIVMAWMAYAGDTASGTKALAPFRALTTPIVDQVKEIPYPAMYPPEGEHHPIVAARSMFLRTIDVAVAETMLEHLEAATAPMAVVQIRILGGAMARVPVEATAFAHRHQQFMVGIAAMYEDPVDASTQSAWVDRMASALHQGDTNVYVNFLGDEGHERIRQAYPGPTWNRLVDVKKRYDPMNLFRHNQNIPPTGVEAGVDSGQPAAG